MSTGLPKKPQVARGISRLRAGERQRVTDFSIRLSLLSHSS
jgi:hypothetical protein